eukprot:m.98632 g.98632  ORF g.98632 m.98632 type:complete len:368 (+) comp8865_c0_seq3:610-1713(+)
MGVSRSSLGSGGSTSCAGCRIDELHKKQLPMQTIVPFKDVDESQLEKIKCSVEILRINAPASSVVAQPLAHLAKHTAGVILSHVGARLGDGCMHLVEEVEKPSNVFQMRVQRIGCIGLVAFAPQLELRRKRQNRGKHVDFLAGLCPLDCVDKFAWRFFQPHCRHKAAKSDIIAGIDEQDQNRTHKARSVTLRECANLAGSVSWTWAGRASMWDCEEVNETSSAVATRRHLAGRAVVQPGSPLSTGCHGAIDSTAHMVKRGRKGAAEKVKHLVLVKGSWACRSRRGRGDLGRRGALQRFGCISWCMKKEGLHRILCSTFVFHVIVHNNSARCKRRTGHQMRWQSANSWCCCLARHCSALLNMRRDQVL